MNSTANGRPIVPPKRGIVEFNALWHNALKFSEEICRMVRPKGRGNNIL